MYELTLPINSLKRMVKLFKMRGLTFFLRFLLILIHGSLLLFVFMTFNGCTSKEMVAVNQANSVGYMLGGSEPCVVETLNVSSLKRKIILQSANDSNVYQGESISSGETKSAQFKFWKVDTFPILYKSVKNKTKKMFSFFSIKKNSVEFICKRNDSAVCREYSRASIARDECLSKINSDIFVNPFSALRREGESTKIRNY